MNDFEEAYNEGIEKEGEIFLEGRKNKRKLEDLEKEYSRKVKEIRKIYEKSIKKNMKKEIETELEKEKNQEKPLEKKQKPFQVEEINLEKSWKDKKKFEINSWSYRTKLKIKNFFRRRTPNWAIYAYYKANIIFNASFRDLKNFLRRVLDNISETLSKMTNSIKRIFVKINEFVIGIAETVKKLFKKNKNNKKLENGEINGKDKNSSPVREK